MTKRLRHLLAGLAAAAAVAATTVGVPAPASADPGTTCLQPSVSGDLSMVYSGRLTPRLVASDLEGRTSANCPSSNREYKYEVSITNPSTQASESAYSTSLSPTFSCGYLVCTRNGTSIAFGDTASVAHPGSFQDAGLRILAYERIPGFAWPTEPTSFQWYKLTDLGSFDTSGMQQVSLTKCPSYVYRPGCP